MTELKKESPGYNVSTVCQDYDVVERLASGESVGWRMFIPGEGIEASQGGITEDVLLKLRADLPMTCVLRFSVDDLPLVETVVVITEIRDDGIAVMRLKDAMPESTG